ncbi:MAG: deoxyribodipyrimidine photo-lyase, partial [bacterium]
MIQKERLQCLKEQPPSAGDYVLYWMQAAQRGDDNHALEYAIQKANDLKKPLLAFFALTENFPEANARHYLFLLEGLKETWETLRQRGIKLIIQRTNPPKGVVEMARRATFLVTDRGYLRIERQWREEVAKQVSCPFWQVETETVVPVELTSDHEEYSAYTIRRKIKKHLSRFLTPLFPIELRYPSLHFPT